MKNINATPLNNGGSSPSFFYASSTGGLYFTADDSVHGRELWRSDGTAAGTALVADLEPGETGTSYFGGMAELNGQLFFTAGRQGIFQIWRTDGTAAGTTVVSDFPSGHSPFFPHQFLSFHDRLYFMTIQTTEDRRWSLWSSDGTSGGLRPEADQPLLPGATPSSFFAHGDRLYFAAPDSQEKLCLFYTDGTPGGVLGTRLELTGLNRVIRFASGSDPDSPGASALYFVGEQGNGLEAVYRLLANGTVRQVSDPFEAIESLERCGDSMVFMARLQGPVTPYGVSRQIWKITGADATPALLGDTAVMVPLGVMGEDFYYYETASTSSGSLRCVNIPTRQVTVLDTHLRMASTPQVVDGVLYFIGYRDDLRLMQTRGTPETTVLLSDKLSDTWLAVMRHQLFFQADDGIRGAELHALDIAGRLEISHITGQHDETIVPVKADRSGVVDLGPQYASYLRSSRLRLRNTGRQTLLNVTLPAGSAPFLVESLTIPSLKSGEEVIVQVSFHPQVAGQAQETVFITGSSTSGEAFTIPLTLRGTGLVERGRPIITRMPDHRLLRVGEPILAQPDVHSALPLTSEGWQRGSTQVASTSLLDLTRGVRLEDAGLYTYSATNAAGTTRSRPTTLAVVGPAPETVTANEGGVLTLKTTVAAPAGSDITYQWLHGGTPLADIDRVRGARSATLRISGMSEADTGLYECIVTLAIDGKTERSNAAPDATEVRMARTPVFTTTGPFSFFLGEAVNFRMQADGAHFFTVKKLPPGLTMTPDGTILGRPTQAGRYDVIFVATNPAGQTARVFTWEVRALLELGSHEALLSRLPAGADDRPGLGSVVKMTATTSGALSVSLLYEGKTYRATAVPELDFTFEEAGRTQTVSELKIPRGARLPALTLSLRSGVVGVASLYDPLRDTWVSGDLRLTPFSSANRTTAYAGRYNLGMHSYADIQGAGVLTASINTVGMVTWAGKLPDGTGFTGGTRVFAPPFSSSLAFYLHHDLYKGTGSLHGAVEIFGPADPAVPPAGAEPYQAGGSFTWNKAPLPESSPERNYKDGIPLHEMYAEGGSYLPPARGQYLANFSSDSLNAELSIQASGIPEAGGHLTQRFTLTSTHQAKIPPLSQGGMVKAMTIHPQLGTVTGTLVIPNENPKLARTVEFRLLLNSLPTGRHVGYALLPDLPGEDAPPSALKFTPLRSALIELTP